MFTYSDVHNVPVSFQINGKDYQLPLFIGPDFIQWAADLKRQQLDEALSIARPLKDGKPVSLGPEDRMRLAAYFSPPPLDFLAQIDLIPTVEGSAYVFRRCAAKAKIDSALAEAIIATRPVLVRQLAMALTQYAQLLAETRAMYNEPPPTKENSDPLAEADATSDASPSTGGESAPT